MMRHIVEFTVKWKAPGRRPGGTVTVTVSVFKSESLKVTGKSSDRRRPGRTVTVRFNGRTSGYWNSDRSRATQLGDSGLTPGRHCLGLWPGPGRRQLWKLSSQNVLRFFCGLSEAAEGSRCNGCPIKSVSERRSERNRMSASDHMIWVSSVSCQCGEWSSRGR